MEMRLTDDRAWVTLRQSSNSNGFIQWGANEAQGIIFMGFDPELAKEKGFWGKLTSFGSGDLPDKARYPLERVLKHLSTERTAKALFEPISGTEFGEALTDLEQGYLLVVSRVDGVSHVVVRDQRGRKIESEQAKILLRTLRSNLI
jgi:uncharacterized lipoprotein